MANEQNLIPVQELNSRRTPEQHSRDSRKGGKKSGESRRKRKAMKEQIELFLSLPLKDTRMKAKLEELGVNGDDVDNQMAMIISMWQNAMRGNVKAFSELRNTVGEMPVEKVAVVTDVDEKVEELNEMLNDVK